MNLSDNNSSETQHLTVFKAITPKTKELSSVMV